MTVQSSIALECAALAIPVFLCAWLRAPYGAYTQQYERFGVGQTLESPEQISAIPRMLESQVSRPLVESRLWQSINPEKLQGLLSGRHSVADTVKASA